MRTIKTLLADDHDLIRAGLRHALDTLPEVEIVGEAGSGPELALELEHLHPDLLVMDVNMPDFEPVAAVQRFRAAYPALKILVVSAYDDQAYVVGLLAAGVNGYHLKDQPLADLHLAVRRILDGGRWISDPLVNRLVDSRAPAQTSVAALTQRQRELLYLLTQGCSNQRIAHLMDLSIKTVENHLTALYRTLAVESRLEATHYANQHPELLSVPARERLPSQPPSPGETFNILLVDDNPRYRAQLSKLAARVGPALSFYEAGDSDEAVRLAASAKPLLAFVDAVLRDEDGIQCARRIKAVSPATRVILISAYPDRELHRIGLAAGALAFLDKRDVDAAAVRQVVEDALETTR